MFYTFDRAFLRPPLETLSFALPLLWRLSGEKSLSLLQQKDFLGDSCCVVPHTNLKVKLSSYNLGYASEWNKFNVRGHLG
jgi:hypothetical protein